MTQFSPSRRTANAFRLPVPGRGPERGVSSTPFPLPALGTGPGGGVSTHRRWTTDETARLIEFFRVKSRRELAAEFGRNVNEVECAIRKLNLRFDGRLERGLYGLHLRRQRPHADAEGFADQ
jgi:hypothetical protein